MKVLMLAPEPFFEPRGTPISVYQRLRALSKLGHRIDLITYHVGEDVAIPHVKIHRTASIPFVKQVKVGPSFIKPILDFFLTLKAFNLLLRNHYDLIHSHEEAAFIATFLAWTFRIPHVYDMHSSLPVQLKNSKYGAFRPLVALFAWLERWTLMHSDVVITIGEDLRDHILTMNPDAEVLIIENFPMKLGQLKQAEIPKLPVDDGKIPVVYTGNFEAYQGLELVFGSARILKGLGSPVQFFLIGGKGHQIQLWQRCALEQGLEGMISFTGSVSLEHAFHFVNQSAILISPRVDGMSVPLKIYSYLQSGKPIVATRIHAHTQVLSDEIAVLVEPNEAAFAEGIQSLIDEPERGMELGRKAKAFAMEEYKPSRLLGMLEQAYSKASKAMDWAEQHVEASK